VSSIPPEANEEAWAGSRHVVLSPQPILAAQLARVTDCP
jgi:hypothetical protein